MFEGSTAAALALAVIALVGAGAPTTSEPVTDALRPITEREQWILRRGTLAQRAAAASVRLVRVVDAGAEVDVQTEEPVAFVRTAWRGLALLAPQASNTSFQSRVLRVFDQDGRAVVRVWWTQPDAMSAAIAVRYQKYWPGGPPRR